MMQPWPSCINSAAAQQHGCTVRPQQGGKLPPHTSLESPSSCVPCCSLPTHYTPTRLFNSKHTQQEEYIKEEQKNLKRELLRAQEEVKRIQSVPLVIGQFLEMVNATSGIVGSTTGQQRPRVSSLSNAKQQGQWRHQQHSRCAPATASTPVPQHPQA